MDPAYTKLTLEEDAADCNTDGQRTSCLRRRFSLWTICISIACAAAVAAGVCFVAHGRFCQPASSIVSSPSLVRPEVRGVVNFLAVGDWGRNGDFNQSWVADQMARTAESLEADFIISTGDNFYETGLHSVDDPEFTSSFTDIYHHTSLQRPWYVALGNHDYMGDVLLQLDGHLKEKDDRWNCERAFSVRFPLCPSSEDASDEDCSSALEIFFFDTTPFVRKYREDPKPNEIFDWRNLLPWNEQLGAQLKNLSDALDASDATWKIVIGHHPIYSHGHHGDTKELLDTLLPILEDKGVRLYINGHDHDLEHVQRRNSPVHCVTSGGGSKAYRIMNMDASHSGQRFAYPGQGFVSVAATPSSLRVVFYNVHGSIYSFEIDESDSRQNNLVA